MNKARLVKFRAVRKMNGLNLEDVAIKLKVSKAYISMMETGKRSLDYEMAIRMAKIFETKPDDLFYDDLIGVNN